MPLPNLDTRRGYHFDGDLELRPYTDAAESADANETGIEFAVRDIDLAKVVVNHAAIGGTVDGSNYWEINIQVSDVVGGTYTTVATTGILGTAAKTIELPLSGKLNEYLDADSAFIRVQADETGTTAGNLTYGAYITPA
jgi:hypothetical protein